MYDVKDPRAALAAAPPSAGGPAGVSYPADYLIFPAFSPAEQDSDGSRHWYARGQNFVLGYSDCVDSVTFRRADQPDEWMMLLLGDTDAHIAAGGEVTHASARSLVVIPPGTSEVQIAGRGPVVRILSRNAADLCALAVNAGSYTREHRNVAEFAPWPAPADGPRIRVYGFDVPRVEGRLGRIWRCSTLMVNVPYPYEGPRDETKLSPHSHADFEQGSLVVAGEYIHHVRWPWTSDRRAWREDDHEVCGSPSLAVIPPPAIHTSQAIGPGVNHLIDVFAPPRRDFSERPGWVLNASEYPMPA